MIIFYAHNPNNNNIKGTTPTTNHNKQPHEVKEAARERNNPITLLYIRHQFKTTLKGIK